MGWTCKALSVVIVISMLAMVLPMDASSASIIDQEMWDPIDDVKKVAEDGAQLSVTGKDHLDIVYLESSERVEEILNPLTGNVIDTIDWVDLNLTVVGNIRVHEDVQYIAIVDTDSDTYFFSYTNNKPVVGYRLSDGTPVSGLATVSGSTLTFSIRKEVLTFTSKFEWKAVAVENADEKFVDNAPDKIVRITYPYHTSTKHGTVTITGLTRKSTSNIEEVQYRIDSGTWTTFALSEHATDWSTWSHDWDTSGLVDGQHTVSVRARAVDNPAGEYPFTDAITVHTNQLYADPANAPTLSGTRSHSVGDITNYDIEMNPEYIGVSLSGGTEAEMRVTRVETINVNSQSYDTYYVETKQEGEFDLGDYSITQNVDRYTWVLKDTKATVKEETYTNMSGNLPISESQGHTIATYNPPLDRNKFPTYVSEHWTASSTVSSTTQSTVDGEQQPPVSHTVEDNISCECLHQKSVSYGGTAYTCFGIISTTEGSDMYAIEYYHQDYSMPLRIESYDGNRELVATFEMASFEAGTGIWLSFTGAPSFLPEKPIEGHKVEIRASVMNSGEVTATGVTITATEGTTTLATGTISSIAAGATGEVVIEWTPNVAREYNIYLHTQDDMDVSSRVVISVNEESGGLDPVLVGIAVVAVLGIIVAIVVLKKRGKQAAPPPPQSQPMKEEDLEDIKSHVERHKAKQAGGDAEEVQCLKCGKPSTVEVSIRPMSHTCPNCGAKILVK